jgi:predicted transglutaminase-like cysteine proteinase
MKFLKVLNLYFLFCIIIILCSCGDYRTYYNTDKIKKWQERQRITQSNEEIVKNDNDYMRIKEVVQLVVKKAKYVQYVGEESGHDYWKTYEEVVEDGYRGDCEDRAVYYYILLRNTGLINDSDLSMRVVKSYTKKGEYHTICVIYTSEGTIIIDFNKIYAEEDKHTRIEAECDLFSIW